MVLANLAVPVPLVNPMKDLMTSTTIYKPTWLYIKQHNQTGLLYFGKTMQNDPYRYQGSGKYWRRHLKTHGKDITTVWAQQFDNKNNLVEFAEFFSEFHDIKNSPKWANLIDENGLDGHHVGIKFTAEWLANIKIANQPKMANLQESARKANTGRKRPDQSVLMKELSATEKFKNAKSVGMKNRTDSGWKHTEESKNKISDTIKNTRFKVVCCLACKTDGLWMCHYVNHHKNCTP